MNDSDLASLTRDGDHWELRFTRRLSYPRDTVWRVMTEPEHLAAWFPQEIVGARSAGAALRFVAPSGDGFDGEMVVFEPPSVMELMWGTDRIRIELADDADGTVLTLTDRFDEQGKAARDAAGWHECLDRLGCELEGEPQPAWGEPWRAINARYVERLGAEAATIGPPPGWEPATADGA